MTEDGSVRAAVLTLAAVTLVGVLIAVITVAKYQALISEARTACTTAAALDLTKWIDLCRKVEYQE
jgi:uncharacterized membrane protein YqhA